MFPVELGKASITKKNESGAEEIVIGYDLFKVILRAAASTIRLDEAWYLSRYKDVATAVRAGDWKNGKQHYIHQGYLENRLPYNILVDEKFYLNRNPDVAASVAKGKWHSAQQHFESSGFEEGRLPYEGFSLFASEEPTDTDAVVVNVASRRR